MNADLTTVDRLISVLENHPEFPASELACEHAHSARICLLGAMDAEYAANIVWARQAVKGIPKSEVRAEAQHLLAGLHNGSGHNDRKAAPA